MAIAQIVPATQDYFLEQIKKSGLWYATDIELQSIPTDILNKLDKAIIESYQIMPVGLDSSGEVKRLILVTDQYQPLKEAAFFEELLQMPVKIKLCGSDNIKRGILYHYNVRTSLTGAGAQEMYEDEAPDEISKSLIQEKVEKIIITAINENASDIHLLPGDSGTYVLIKIAGRLLNYSNKFNITRNEKIYLVNVIKNMCEPPMNQSQILMPDGGSIKFRRNQNVFNLRVSTMPTIRGQKVVIRLLNNASVPLDLDQLGFLEEDKKAIFKALKKVSGLFVVSGPTGSGKSTTIHAALKKVRGLHHNIITIENPVEHRDELLTQIEMRLEGDERTRLDGAKIFDDILRQDPETIFYTETRNRKDAALLITASLSGHRIMTTLHATDVVESLYRMFDMGISKADLLRQLNGVLSQRLLGLNCPHCAQPYVPDEEETLLLSAAEIEYIMSGQPRKGKGCDACKGGVAGRIVVAESIVLDNAFRDFIMVDRGILEIQEYLREKMQFKSMWEKGLALVHAGKVSLMELGNAISPNV